MDTTVTSDSPFAVLTHQSAISNYSVLNLGRPFLKTSHLRITQYYVNFSLFPEQWETIFLKGLRITIKTSLPPSSALDFAELEHWLKRQRQPKVSFGFRVLLLREMSVHSLN